MTRSSKEPDEYFGTYASRFTSALAISVLLMRGCGGGGGDTTGVGAGANPGPGDQSNIAGPGTAALNPDAPSTPTGLRVTDVSATTVTLVWEASTGGKGGLYSYRIYRSDNEQAPISIAAASGKLTLTDPTYPNFSPGALSPGTEYRYRISAASFTGAASPLSEPITVRTLGFDSMKARFLPYILTLTDGTVIAQGFATPAVISGAATSFGLNPRLIQHAAIDLTVNGVRRTGDAYEIFDKRTGATVEAGLLGLPVSDYTTLPLNAFNPFLTGKACVYIDMTNGKPFESGSACDLAHLGNLIVGVAPTRTVGMYVYGERL